jgi:2-methylcitrate dehydratase PrpD
METLSARLARFVVETTYADLPPAVVEATKVSLLDAIGVSLAASTLGEGCAAFVDLARQAGGRPEATLLGFGDKVPAREAALANGALAHALDYEDAFDGAPLHPNAAVIPAALAIAEQSGGVSGRELITAIAVGCDLVCRIGLCLTEPMESFGWYPPPMFGAYGATAAAARLLGLDAAQTVDAFSLTLNQSTCSGELKVSPNALLRAVRDAFAAHAGVLSAQLAQRGVVGFERPFEGVHGFFQLYVGGAYDPEVLTAGLGQRFHGKDVSLKGWPSCRGTHAYIEAALNMRAAHRIEPAQIAAIHAAGVPLLRMLMEPVEQRFAPATAIDAKFSLPFTIATSLVGGRVTLDDFATEALGRPEVLSLARLVDYEVLPDWGAAQMAAGRLEIRLKGGASHKREVAHALGHPANPIGRPALLVKFKDCARRAARPLSDAAIDRLARTILELESADDVGAALFGRDGLGTTDAEGARDNAA